MFLLCHEHLATKHWCGGGRRRGFGISVEEEGGMHTYFNLCIRNDEGRTFVLPRLKFIFKSYVKFYIISIKFGRTILIYML
jgi:hypothetical protein